MRIASLTAAALLALGGTAFAQGASTGNGAATTGTTTGAGMSSPSAMSNKGTTHRHRTRRHVSNQGTGGDSGDATGHNSQTGSVINSHVDTGGTPSPN